MVDFHWIHYEALILKASCMKYHGKNYSENLLDSTYQMLTRTCQQELHFYTFRQAHASTQRLDLHFPIQKQ